MKGLETDPFSFKVLMYAIEGLGTNLFESGPEVLMYNIEAIMVVTEPSIKPTFLDSEPMHTGRKWKANDMSRLTLCLCEEHAKPGDIGLI